VAVNDESESEFELDDEWETHALSARGPLDDASDEDYSVATSAFGC